MKASRIINASKYTSLFNLAIKNNDEAMIEYVNIACIELYRRFNLGLSSETIIVSEERDLYELKASNVDLVMGIYAADGSQLFQKEMKGDPDSDFKMLTYKSFILNNKKHPFVVVYYRSSPEYYTSLDDEVAIPDAFMSAMLLYVAYLGHSTINSQEIDEASRYLQRYDAICAELLTQGYRLEINNEQTPIQEKGFL